MTSGNAAGNVQKQEISENVGVQKTFTDKIKEDGIRKELYENERKARENWNWKWGFYKNSKKLFKKEALKRGLNVDINTILQKNFTSGCEDKTPSKVTLLPSKGVPKKCSGMIGWRAFPKENNLERLVGPMYVSPKVTMDPPLGPEEPDLRYQKVIFLG